MTTEAVGSRSSKYQQQEPSSTNGGTANQKKPKKKKRIFLRILLILFALGCIAFLSGVALFWSYAKNAPKLSDAELSATSSSKLYDINNVVFEDLGSEKRELIQPTEVPQLLKDAVVSIEDKRFYKHVGVDPIRIVGSALSNLKSGGRQGGSTLTQQLIKLSYFSTDEKDQTLKRKSQEAWMALQLEKEKSKEEILTYYINKVYMANGIYGMETAAETYFDKTLGELNLAQTALLAGMPQAPNDYDPYTHPDYAKERRDIVLLTMYENKKISKTEYDEAKATPVEDGLKPLEQSNENRKLVDNYVTEVIAEVESKTGKNVYTDGLDIYTNLDMDAQKHLYDVVNTDDYVQYPDDDFQVASTVLDVKTGRVAAQIGGRKIPDDVQMGGNFAVNTGRDVGSTMKPIADYGPAIENLDYSTGTILHDRSTNYPGTNTSVTNSDLQYYGDITMRRAIMGSRNTTAVQTLDAVGKDNSLAFLNNLGIDFKTMEYANAISSNTTQDGTKYGVSTLKLAGAYAAFANDGVYNKPYYVNKIMYQDGTEENYEADSKRAMKDSTAYMMTDMLKDVINGGTAFNAAVPGLVQAGKTGTSNYDDAQLAAINSPTAEIAPDSTFVGYTPNYAIAVWTGYKELTTPITSEFWSTASEIYREMITYLSLGRYTDDWTMPDNVVKVGNELYVKGAYEVTTPVPSISTVVPESTTPSSVTQPSSSPIEEQPSSTVPEPTPTSSSEPIQSSTNTEPNTSNSNTGTINSGAADAQNRNTNQKPSG